jgi:hypothetical protein
MEVGKVAQSSLYNCHLVFPRLTLSLTFNKARRESIPNCPGTKEEFAIVNGSETATKESNHPSDAAFQKGLF